MATAPNNDPQKTRATQTLQNITSFPVALNWITNTAKTVS